MGNAFTSALTVIYEVPIPLVFVQPALEQRSLGIARNRLR